MKKLFVSFLMAAALSVASAATHRLTLFQESIVAGTTLKPGEYKLVVEDGKAVIPRDATVLRFPSKSRRTAPSTGRLRCVTRTATANTA